MDRERDLLFGVVAFQNGAVDADGLAETCAAWLKEPAQPLADLLVGNGFLTAEQRTDVEKIVARELASHGGDPQATLMATIDGRSLDVIGKLGESSATLALEGTLGRVPAGGHRLPPETPSPGEARSDAESRQRYTLTHVYAKGGIGRVWLADDETLGRQIALKELHPDQVDNAIACSRFLYEARITAQLEHPGIVPVYELGEGRSPYYTMRFVRGRTLNEASRAYHKKRAAGEADALGMVELLTAFVAVCHAVAYAHSREIIHRDLKGQNVVLGDFGEVIVLDWGLAKRVSVNDVRGERAEPMFAVPIPPNPQTPPTITCADADTGDGGFTLPEPADNDAGPSPGAAHAGGSVGGRAHGSKAASLSSQLTERESGAGLEGTVQGQLLGTPGFMAPEQAQGRHDQVDQRTDVYGLGAILYEILTGRPPFVGAKTSEVIRQVYQEDPIPPRQLVETIAPALEAVCLKALRKERGDRYASASELAQDVQRHLADQPVSAYPERRVERLGRWFRKHRTWTVAAVASLIGICLVATIAVAVIEGSRRSEAAARREAELNFTMAQKAVDSYLTSVSENTLLKEQDSVDVRNLRQELLQSALQYYQQFVNQRSQDPRLRQELANAYFRVGEITREISSKQQALESFRSAETIWQQLADLDPKNDELQGRLAACQIKTGELQRQTGDIQGALNLLSHAQAILEPLAVRNPQVPLYQANLADCVASIGLIRADLESPDQALAMLQKAKAICQQLVGRSPDDIGYQRRLAEVVNELGYVFYKRLDYPAALQAFREVQEISQALLEQLPNGPKPVRVVDWLARSYYNMATIQLRLDQKAEALRSLEQSLQHRTALVAAHPSVTSFQEDLGGDYREISALQHSTGQDDKSFVSAQKALEIFERLVQLHPDRARFHSDLGRSWNLFGVLHDEARDNVKAIPEFQRAVAEQERAVSASKDVNEYKVYLAVHLDNLGEEYVDLGQVDEGLQYYMKALAIRRELHRAHADSREYALDLTTALLTIGAIERQAGRATAARKSLTEARELLESLAAARPLDAAISGRLGMALTREAVADAEERNAQAALSLLARARDLLTPLVSAAKPNPEDRERLSEALWQLSRLDRAAGKSAEADRLGAERLALWKRRPAAELAALALKEATRAILIGYGKTPIPERAQAIRDLDLDLAAADLRLAISQGFTDLALIRSNPDSAILIEHDDLKALIKGLEAAGWPSQP
jgi:eukaryotic-like serine/threonine-protein kinase